MRAQDYAGARRWLVEARAAGANPASIGAIDAALGAAQDEAQRASSYVSASSMTRTRYVSPQFPLAARQRAIGFRGNLALMLFGLWLLLRYSVFGALMMR